MPYDGIDHERKAKCVQEATTAGAKGAALGLGRGPLLFTFSDYTTPLSQRST